MSTVMGFSTMPSILTVQGRIGSFCAWATTFLAVLNS